MGERVRVDRVVRWCRVETAETLPLTQPPTPPLSDSTGAAGAGADRVGVRHDGGRVGARPGRIPRVSFPGTMPMWASSASRDGRDPTIG